MTFRPRGVFRTAGLILTTIYLGWGAFAAGYRAVFALMARDGQNQSITLRIPGIPALHGSFLVAVVMAAFAAIQAALLVGLLRKWRPAQFIVMAGAGLMALQALWGLLSLILSKIPPLELGLLVYLRNTFVFFIDANIAIYAAMELWRPKPLPDMHPSSSSSSQVPGGRSAVASTWGIFAALQVAWVVLAFVVTRARWDSYQDEARTIVMGPALIAWIAQVICSAMFIKEGTVSIGVNLLKALGALWCSVCVFLVSAIAIGAIAVGRSSSDDKIYKIGLFCLLAVIEYAYVSWASLATMVTGPIALACRNYLSQKRTPV